MNLRFSAVLAAREARHGLRRVGVYMASITLGVAALVSIHSFRADVARSVQDEAEKLMGANARLSANRAFPDTIDRVLDSLAASGVGTARVTTAMSMVAAPTSGGVRLLQVQGIAGDFPFYGTVTTRPADVWGAQGDPGRALVDPAVLSQLGIQVGDSLVVGGRRFEIAGVVEDMPTDVGFQTAIGPRVFLSARAMADAGILGFGSLARYQAFLRMPDPVARARVEERYRTVFRQSQVRFTTADRQARNLANGIRFLGRYLALVGLGALLLGGIGVASAIHVYVRERRDSVAVLRCVGGTQWTLFHAYLIQAAGLGLLGSLAGVVLGVGVQRLLPVALADVLPVDVATRFSVSSALAGLGVGVWVAVIFALIPLLEVRNVPPLAALRRDFEAARRGWDGWRFAAYVAVGVSVTALCVLEAPEPKEGMVFAAALAAAIGALASAGWGLTRATHRFLPHRASYPIRQGVSNLFRPRNQTLSVTLALGFGAFVVGTVLEVEENVRDDLQVALGGGRPNLVLFDIQPDQLDGVMKLLPDEARPHVEVAPIVPSRIAALNGRTIQELREDTTEARPERWALRREYRNTYRLRRGNAERVVEGQWWNEAPVPGGGTRKGTVERPARISVERDLAGSLGVGLGDRVTWDIGGRRVETVVTSLRVVDWKRFEPNFFVVFEPGVLEEAPHTNVMLARIGDGEALSAFQRRLVDRYPNVSAIDVSRVQETVESILGKVRQAVGFLGVFSALAGLIVLTGALATSRAQRTREGALLKTLGARRSQVLTVLLTEYLALGTLATVTGLVLAWAAAAALVPRAFDVAFSPHLWALLAVWGSVVGLTIVVGLAGSRSVVGRPPMVVLREVD